MLQLTGMRNRRQDRIMKILILVKSDFMKLNHTPFYWIHVIVPLITMMMFLGYYSYSKLNSISKVNGFFETISLGFPLLIGIICSLVMEQEMKAGKFREMISTENSRWICLLSKIIVVITSGALAFTLTTGGFYIGFQYILKQNILPLSFYINIALIIFAAQIFLYIFHLWLSIRFGSGASIGMGIFESLISALFITGLGDGIWQYVPCSFAVRFCDNFFIKELGTADVFNKLSGSGYWFESCKSGVINCIVITVISIVIFKIWFEHFEFRNCD